MYTYNVKPYEIDVSKKELMLSVSSSSSRYKRHLENKKKEKALTVKDQQRAELKEELKKHTEERDEHSKVCKRLEEGAAKKFMEAADEDDSVKRKELAFSAKGMKREAQKLRKRMLALEDEIGVLKKK